MGLQHCKHAAAALFAAMAGLPSEATPAKTAIPVATATPAAIAPEAEDLAPALKAWVDNLTRIEQTESEDYPPELQQRLVYVLSLKEQRSNGAMRLFVAPVSTRLLKNGDYSVTTQAYSPSAALQPNPAKFLRPSDHRILKRLNNASYTNPMRDLSLHGEEGSGILEAIIASGRACWNEVSGPVLTRGETRHAAFRWCLGDDATQHVHLDVEEAEGLEAFALAPPWYIDEANGVLGSLETGLGPRIAESLLAVPPVPAVQAAALRRVVGQRFPALALLAPPKLEPAIEVHGPPKPRLTLAGGEPFGYYARSGAGSVLPVARLSFCYRPVEIADDDTRVRPATAHNGRVVEVVRDEPAERRVLKEMRTRGFGRRSRLNPYDFGPGVRDDFTMAGGAEGRAWRGFLYEGAPELQAAGWEIVVDPSFPIRLVRADGPVEADLRESSGVDWLELNLGVLVDGERVELTPVLLGLITESGFDTSKLSIPIKDTVPIYITLADGRLLAIPAERIRRMIAALYELFSAGMFSAKDKAVRFTRFDAASLSAMQAATNGEDFSWRGGEQLRKLGEMLRATDGIPHADVPTSFAATLRPYQQSGVNWLQFLRTAGLGAVLADDMGLGKTVQTLAHIVTEKENGRLTNPVLIVSPTSVVPNWRQEAARFAPQLKVLVLQGLTRKERFSEIAAHDIVLTTYPLLSRDREWLVGQEWHTVVLDEAQAIKNPDAIAARVARELRAGQRLCLTGTPVENHLGELWSLFSFLSPGFLGDRTSFNRNWRRPIEAEGNEERRQQLARRVKPFLLRRTKEEVATELPPKTEMIVSVEMESAQRDVYETVRLAMQERVRKAIAAQGLARSHIILLDALLKMRQACCDPRLLKLESAKAAKARSAKFDRLMEMLPELLAEGRHILLFSQFTSMLALIEEGLNEAGIPYVLLTGDTRDRETPVRTFQSGEVPLFLISLKAGGLGLNLTAADTVIHYDPWWNPAVEDQATDRAHRIGQEKPVFVYRMVTLDSIEVKMESLKDRKRDIAAGIFDAGTGTALDLSDVDIDELFAPA